jgi:hypothetical protein
VILCFFLDNLMVETMARTLLLSGHLYFLLYLWTKVAQPR